MRIKLLKHKGNIDRKSLKEISLILVDKIVDVKPDAEEIKGKTISLDDLADDVKYRFKVRTLELGNICSYPLAKFSKYEIKKEIQILNSADIFGEYFVAKCKRRKM